jgi:ferritin-like metal-binding protein YciE
MDNGIEGQIVTYLTEAHAMEKQSIQLLEKAPDIAGDQEIASIYRAHLLQTQEHERYVRERLEAHGSSPSTVRDTVMQAGAVVIGLGAQAAPDTPVRLATTAFAFENLEVAAYRMLQRLAARAGDTATLSVVERILEQEEAAAELVAGTFDRALEIMLGERADSPVPPVTPLGKPSERSAASAEHEGPQSYKQTPPDEPVGQPPHIDTPTEGEHLRSPEPGYPAGDTKPFGVESSRSARQGEKQSA